MADAWLALLGRIDAEVDAAIDHDQRQLDEDLDRAFRDSMTELGDRQARFGPGDEGVVSEAFQRAVVSGGALAVRDGVKATVALVVRELQDYEATPIPAEAQAELLRALETNTAWFDALPRALEEPIRAVLAAAVREPLSVTELADLLRPSLAARKSDARTLVETSLKVMDRLAVDAAGERLGYTYRLYAGPRDRANRPFCKRMAGWVWPVAALQACDNGMLPDVLLTCGGWECRHNARPISLALARDLYPGRVVLQWRTEVLVVSPAREASGSNPARAARTITVAEVLEAA